MGHRKVWKKAGESDQGRKSSKALSYQSQCQFTTKMQLHLTFQLILKSFSLRFNSRYSLTFASNSFETGVWREADRFSPAWHFGKKPPLALLLGARRDDQYRSQICSVNRKWQQHGRCENDKTAPPEVKPDVAKCRVSRVVTSRRPRPRGATASWNSE